MNEKTKFGMLMAALVLVILDAVGFLTTSIIGKVIAENNNMTDSHYAMLLVPIFIGLGIYFFWMIWN